MKKVYLKAREVSTGKPVKVEIVAPGSYRNQDSGKIYFAKELKFAKSSWQLGFHVGVLGFFLVCREFLKTNTFYIFPAACISWHKGYDFYCDLEIKFLCFAIGLKFIIINR